MKLVPISQVKIEDIGVKDEWVYDLETDTHDFFAGDVLVHNSNYYTVEPLVNKWLKEHPDASFEDICDYCLEIEEKHIVPTIQKCIDDFAAKCNAPNPWAMAAKREVLCDCLISVAKKRYTARVVDDEGVRLAREAAHIKVQGLELVKAITPKWCKIKLKEAIPLLFDFGESELINWLDNIKHEFIERPINEVAMSHSVSSLDFVLGTKKIPINARSALVYNKFIRDSKLEGQFSIIQVGDKPKRIYLRDGNPWHSNVISWVDESFVEYIKDWVDWDTSFEKFFLSPLEIMAKALNYDITRRTSDLDSW